jgi:predicted NUDIX family NTP pyrophosphohydrolase
LLLYRVADGSVEVLLAHPGGPLWARRDLGAWSVPKGEADGDESLEAVARREFAEETGHEVPAGLMLVLGEVRQAGGKVVHAWAVEGDLEPAVTRSNTFEMEWPPRSGRRAAFPEVDRVAWFGLAEARERINPAQAVLLDRLVATLTEREAGKHS